MTELEMICQKSGIEVSQCDCPICQSMCLRAPCIGTPSDIVKLVNNGYIHALELTCFEVPQLNIQSFLSVQIRQEHGGCPLFKDGKCTVHEIKPTDGKLANCKNLHLGKGDKPDYLELIAESWNELSNMGSIRFLINSIYKYQSLNKEENVVRVFNL